MVIGGMKPVIFIGSSQDELCAFPDNVRKEIGYALFVAQQGEKHPDAEPLRGYKGSGVLEVIANDDGNTYRTIYTVRLSEAVYVLHAFQKKSTQGIKTPKRHLDLVEKRLKDAEVLNAKLRAQAGTTRGKGLRRRDDDRHD